MKNPDVVYMSDFESSVYIPFVTSAGLLLPLFVLIIGLIRKRMMNNQGVVSDDE